MLYPPRMGSPSELIESGRTGIVADPGLWGDLLAGIAGTEEHTRIGQAARALAIAENWAVQAQRFNELFESVLGR